MYLVGCRTGRLSVLQQHSIIHMEAGYLAAALQYRERPDRDILHNTPRCATFDFMAMPSQLPLRTPWQCHGAAMAMPWHRHRTPQGHPAMRCRDCTAGVLSSSTFVDYHGIGHPVTAMTRTDNSTLSIKAHEESATALRWTAMAVPRGRLGIPIGVS